MFQSLAGYSLGKADIVRRAMSKKKMKELEKERVTFLHGDESQGIDGAIKRGVPESVATELFDEIMDFANYAFNKAHAVSYAFISYQTAWLKCHYPKEFMAALLTSVLDNRDKLKEYIQSVRNMGISLMSPDINTSAAGFSVEGNRIRFGISAIKDVGESFCEQFLERRRQSGAFTCFQDFCERMSRCGLTSRALKALIQTGAFDSMGYRRSQLLPIVDTFLRNITRQTSRNNKEQMDLFHLADEPVRDSMLELADVPEYPIMERLRMEKETMGIYLSGHPMDAYHDLAQKVKAAAILQIVKDIAGENENPVYQDGMQVRLACVLSHIERKFTKKGERIAFLTVEDETGSMEVIVFSRALEQYDRGLREGEAVLLIGKISSRDNNAKIILNQLSPLNEQSVGDLLAEDAITEPKSPISQEPSICEDERPKKLFIRIPSMQDKKLLQRVKRILGAYKGDTPVTVCPSDREKGVKLPSECWCRIDIALIRQLENVFGEENVVVKTA